MTGGAEARWRWAALVAATLLGGLTLGVVVGLATRSPARSSAGSPGLSGSVTTA